MLDIILNCTNFRNSGYNHAGLLDDVISNFVQRKSICAHPYVSFIISYSGDVVTTLRKCLLSDFNSKPCTGCSSTVNNLILMTPNGPFIPRPRDRRTKIDYLERYLR